MNRPRYPRRHFVESGPLSALSVCTATKRFLGAPVFCHLVSLLRLAAAATTASTVAASSNKYSCVLLFVSAALISSLLPSSLPPCLPACRAAKKTRRRVKRRPPAEYLSRCSGGCGLVRVIALRQTKWPSDYHVADRRVLTLAETGLLHLPSSHQPPPAPPASRG